MAVLGLCFLLNLFIIVYFAAKKWNLVACVYIFALLLLSTISLLLFKENYTTTFFIRTFGIDGYDSIMYALEIFSYGALLPYLGIELLTMVITIVIAIKAAEAVIATIRTRRKELSFTNNVKRKKASCHSFEVMGERRKLYLENCLILC